MIRIQHLGWALLALLPFLPALLGGRAFLFRDLTNIQVPYKATWLSAVTELGRIPHWDPLHVGGFRFVADLSYGPLYPLNALFFLWRGDATAGMSAFILVHHALIFLGFFLYLRDLRLRLPLCVAGGLAAAWMGAVVSSQNLLHHLCGQAAVGFFLFCWSRALRRRGPGWELFGASLALAWPVYGGDPQYSYLLGLLAAWMAAVSRAPWRDKGWKLPLLVALLVLAAAPQLFSTWDYLRESGRFLDQQTDDQKLVFSLHPLRLFELIFPLLFGARPGEFWARHLLGGLETPFLFSIYSGAALSVFAGLRLFLRRPWRGLRLKGAARTFAGPALFLLLLLLALGSFSPIPLYRLALKALPFWENFRYPERLGYWISLFLILYSLKGAEKWLRLRGKAGKARIELYLGGAFLLLLLATAAWTGEQRASRLALAQGAAAFLGVLLLLRLARKRTWLPWALCALIGADFAVTAHRLAWSQPAALTRAETYDWATKLLADRAKNGELLARGDAHRFFTVIQDRLPAPENFPIPLADEDDRTVYSAWAGMKFNTPSAWGIPLVRGHGSLVPNPPALRLSAISQTLALRLLALYSTRWMLLLEKGAPRVIVNQEALPRVSFPAEAEYITSETALGERLRAERWDPMKSVLLEREPAPWTGERPAAQVLRVEQRWDHISIAARAPDGSPPRWLLVNERFDPGWKITLHGKELRYVRANGWALGVELPALEAGEFTVELAYFDSAYQYGKLAFCAWLLLLTGLLVARKPGRA